MAKISVLVPVYNVERYLRQCLDSIVQQTMQDMEVICVDDGATDSSGIILDEYASKNSKIKVIHKTNRGYGHTMNVALKNATGEYIGIVESDDFVDRTMFDSLYGYALQTGADIIKSNYWQYEDGQDIFREVLAPCKYNVTYCPRRQDPSIFYCMQTIWSAIYRKEFLETHQIFFNETPGASYQDVSFAFKTLACAEKVFLIKDAFLHYRTDNPHSSIHSKEKVYCIFDEISNVEIFLEDKTDIRERCFLLFSPLMFKVCYESYNRISLRYKMPYLCHAIEIFKSANRKGYIKREYWEDLAWQQVQEMLTHSSRFLYASYQEIQKRRLIRDGFWKTIVEYQGVYLYGAGKAARHVMNLIQSKIRVRACLVSDITGNPSSLSGVPVVEYSSVEMQEENTAILLAIREESQYEIFQRLQSDGCENVIPLDRELKRSLEGI